MPMIPSEVNVPKRDARVVSNPTSDLSAREVNRTTTEVCKLSSGATYRMWVRFATALADGAITPTAGSAEWGAGSASWPSVERDGAGVYVLTALPNTPVPGTWSWPIAVDANGRVTETVDEEVVFSRSRGEIEGQSTLATARAYLRSERSGNVVTVYVYDSSDTLSDLGGGVELTIEAG